MPQRRSLAALALLAAVLTGCASPLWSPGDASGPGTVPRDEMGEPVWDEIGEPSGDG